MKQYLDLMRHVYENGTVKTDRTGTGTKSVFGHQMRFDLSEGFPVITTKKLHLRSIIHELLWFLKGDTNIAYLKDNGVKIWDEWADENGNLGPVWHYLPAMPFFNFMLPMASSAASSTSVVPMFSLAFLLTSPLMRC